jgi:hypothetical protein
MQHPAATGRSRCRPHRGGTPTQVTDDPEFDRYVSRAPDGRSLVFRSYRGGKYEVYRSRIDWSPGGDRLAGSSYRGNAPRRAGVLDLATTH